MPRAEPAIEKALTTALGDLPAPMQRLCRLRIAAFLRALPEGSSVPAGQGDLRVSVGPMPALAAAVERAAAEVE